MGFNKRRMNDTRCHCAPSTIRQDVIGEAIYDLQQSSRQSRFE